MRTSSITPRKNSPDDVVAADAQRLVADRDVAGLRRGRDEHAVDVEPLVRASQVVAPTRPGVQRNRGVRRLADPWSAVGFAGAGRR